MCFLRQWFCQITMVLVVISVRLVAAEKQEVTLDYVAGLAEVRSRQVFKDLRGSLPDELSVENHTYARYRGVRFIPEQA